MLNKEIIIDGIKYFRQIDINKGLDEEPCTRQERGK